MPENSKRMRLPIDQTQRSELSDMLGQVPHKKVLQYDWTSDSGRAFIKAVRKIQITGHVPLPWIAEALDVPPAALAGAIGYWERASATRGTAASRRKRGEKRPLRKPPAEGEE